MMKGSVTVAVSIRLQILGAFPRKFSQKGKMRI